MERVESFVALFSGFYEVLCIMKRVASFLWIIWRKCAASGIHRRPGEPLAEGSRRRENKQGEGFKLDRNTSYLNWAETKSIVDPHSDGWKSAIFDVHQILYYVSPTENMTPKYNSFISRRKKSKNWQQMLSPKLQFWVVFRSFTILCNFNWSEPQATWIRLKHSMWVWGANFHYLWYKQLTPC